MNNLIVERATLCPIAANIRSKFEILFPPWNFIRQADRTANHNYSQPYVRRSLYLRYAYTSDLHYPRNSIFANYSATFSHLPLFQHRATHCIPEHNKLSPLGYLSPVLLLHLLFLRPVSHGLGVCRKFIYHGYTQPINISIRVFAVQVVCETQSENDDTNRIKFTHTYTDIYESGSIKFYNGLLFLQNLASAFLWKWVIIRDGIYRQVLSLSLSRYTFIFPLLNSSLIKSGNNCNANEVFHKVRERISFRCYFAHISEYWDSYRSIRV